MKKRDCLRDLWRLDLNGHDRRIEALIQRPPHPMRPESLDYGRRLSALRDRHAEIRRALAKLAELKEEEDLVRGEADVEALLRDLGKDLSVLESQVAYARI